MKKIHPDAKHLTPLLPRLNEKQSQQNIKGQQEIAKVQINQLKTKIGLLEALNI